jgi:hypothetical protein
MMRALSDAGDVGLKGPFGPRQICMKPNAQRLRCVMYSFSPSGARPSDSGSLRYTVLAGSREFAAARCLSQAWPAAARLGALRDAAPSSQIRRAARQIPKHRLPDLARPARSIVSAAPERPPPPQDLNLGSGWRPMAPRFFLLVSLGIQMPTFFHALSGRTVAGQSHRIDSKLMEASCVC